MRLATLFLLVVHRDIAVNRWIRYWVVRLSSPPSKKRVGTEGFGIQFGETTRVTTYVCTGRCV